MPTAHPIPRLLARAKQLESRHGLELACGRKVIARLLPHQILGVQWLAELHASGAGGAILSDDMGMGKSAQASCFLSLCTHNQVGAALRQHVCDQRRDSTMTQVGSIRDHAPEWRSA